MAWQYARPSIRQSVNVCLFVTRRYCVETAKHIEVFFDRRLATPYQTLWQYSDGNPSAEGGGMNQSRFLTNISLYLENDTR